MFKLFFSKNLRRLDSNFKTARSNFNMFYKGHFYGKLKKKYFRRNQATFLIPKKAVKTMLLKTHAFAANHNSNKKFKDNW